MTQHSKMPLDIEEKIQSLAGDIYVQIEDKVSAFVSNYANPVEITNDVIENHSIYQSLHADFIQLKKEVDQAKLSNSTEIASYEKTIATLTTQVENNDAAINNGKQLNSAKFSDTEKALKEKQNELSTLSDSYNKLSQQHESQTKSLMAANKQLETSLSKIKTLEASEKTIIKNDNAKTVTLSVQNDQISDLTFKLKNITSELDNLKAEHSQQSVSSNKQLTQELKTVKQHKKEIADLQKNITQVEKSLTSEKIIVKQLTSEISTSNQKYTELNLNIELLQKKLITLNEQLSLSESTKKEAEHLLDIERQRHGKQQSKQLLEIDALKKSIDSQRSELAIQASTNKQTIKKVEKLDQEVNNLEKEKTQHQQKVNELEKTHQLTLAELNKNLSQTQVAAKTFEEKYNQHKSVLAEQTSSHQNLLKKNKAIDTASSKQAAELTDKLALLEKNVIELTAQNKMISNNYKAATESVETYKLEINTLKEKYSNANLTAEDTKKRIEVNKKKQESEYNKARDTIKYLRDENLELHTQLDQKVTALEDKLREYRLRFEYAQKQLNQK